MKNTNVKSAFKAFEVSNQKAIKGGEVHWTISGSGTDANGKTYQDWSSSTGEHACGKADSWLPGDPLVVAPTGPVVAK